MVKKYLDDSAVRVSKCETHAFLCQVVRRVGLERTPTDRLPKPGFFRALVKVTWAAPSDYHCVGDYVITDLKELEDA